MKESVIYEDIEYLKKAFNNNSQIIKATKFAIEAHKGQTRKSGENYILHPIAVALKLWGKYQNETLAIAGLLHDTVEDNPEIEIAEVYKQFGKNVGFIVDALNKREYCFYEYPKKKFQDKIERFLWAGLKDIKVFIVKIADREHNLETLHNLKEKKQVRMAFETQAIFEPLKKILGYEKNMSLNTATNNFKSFLAEKKIKYDEQKFLDLKNILYEDGFENFNEESFKIVYENASHIVWQIEGWEMFDKLCESKTFKDKIEILEVKSDGTNVLADFKFKEGVVFDNKSGLKLKISTYTDK